MTPRTKTLHDIAASVYLAAAGAIASVVAFGWFIYDKFSPTPWSDLAELVILLLVGVVVIGFGLYSVRVRQENNALRRAIDTIHKINHDYRDVLSKVFGGKQPITDPEARIVELERATLQAVCQSTAKIFNSFTHADCMVTVKLIDKDGDGRLSCGTYARSQSNCERDRVEPSSFAINAGQNTAFDEAIRFSPGRISHFHSYDLTDLQKTDDYRNQRPNWERYYKSAIVVPIRYLNPQRAGMPDASDDIGFLCVDTKSTYRLNDEHHLHLLAALADQMYNFMSLMRGKYQASLPEKNEA